MTHGTHEIQRKNANIETTDVKMRVYAVLRRWRK